ncbi:retrotransposon hot spot (RHS) protein [Trypanosoma cruzi]|nr:retrotransposon hot spot (RHS) protein [Trypanosoma cruzi]
MILPSVPHEAVGNFLGFIGGVASYSCRVVDLYSAMHGEGMCGDNFLQWSDASSTGSVTEEWWLRAPKLYVNGECNMKGGVTALFCDTRIADIFHKARKLHSFLLCGNLP